MGSVTLVTAMMNIKRESEGDGRPFSKYLEWMSVTSKTPADMIIFVQKEYAEFVSKARRDVNAKTLIIEEELEKVPLYARVDEIKKVIQSDQYKKKMRDTRRVECSHAEYLAVIHSKFYWLNKAITLNPFKSEKMYWIDSGICKYFSKEEVEKPFILRRDLPDRFAVQVTHDFDQHDYKQYGYFDNVSVVRAWFFGGSLESCRKVIGWMGEAFEEMMKEGSINNEQIAMERMIKEHRDDFYLFYDPEMSFVSIRSNDENRAIGLKNDDKAIHSDLGDDIIRSNGKPDGLYQKLINSLARKPKCSHVKCRRIQRQNAFRALAFYIIAASLIVMVVVLVGVFITSLIKSTKDK